MKYRGIFEYEYPTEHKPPVSIDVYLHGDCVKGKIIEWEYRPLEQEPRKDEVILTNKEYRELMSNEYDHGYCKGYAEALEEQEPILDKIRAEIDQYLEIEGFGSEYRNDVKGIIDKYKAETEE